MEQELQVALQLMQAQQLPQARQILKQFTKKNPKHIDGWFLFGQLERTLQNWPDAIAHLRKAQQLDPQALTVTEYLAMTQVFSNQGRAMIPAIENFAALLKAAPTSPSAVAIAVNLQTLCLRADEPVRLLTTLRPFYEQYAPQGAERLRLAAGLAMASYITGDIQSSEAFAREVVALRAFAYDGDDQPLPGDYPFYFIYVEFILGLIAARQQHASAYEGPANKQLHTIGESHCLTPAHLILSGHCVQAHLLMGAKAYYFGIEQGETWRYQIERIIGELPKTEPLVMMFGEIDCRANEGIMRQWLNDPAYPMESEVALLVQRYVKFIKIAQLRRAAPTYLYGVPAPAQSQVVTLAPARYDDFKHMVAHFNACLANEAAAQSLPFIDIYALTVGEDGWARAGVHLDGIHLIPEVVMTAIHRAWIS